MNQLQCERVTKIFGQEDQECTILQDVSVTFDQGMSYALMGVSGSGKSTFLSLLAGLEDPTTGFVLLNGTSISELVLSEPRSFFYATMGIVFQRPHLLKELSVLENVIIKGIIAGQSFISAEPRGRALLQQVGLEHKASMPVVTLSGGEQQRIAVARALFTSPLFLLADEPTAHLDPVSKNIVLKLLLDYTKEQGKSLIVTCHDPLVAKYMDKIFSIEQSRIKEQV